MKAYRVQKYKSVRKGCLYQSRNPLIRWYFYKRLSIVLKLSHIQGDDTVLDIGAGEGFFLPTLVARTAKVYAMDSNTTIIRERHTNCWEWGRGKTVFSCGKELLSTELGASAAQRCNFFYAKAQHLPISNQSINIVFMLDVLEHIPPADKNLVLSEINRVSVGDGIFVCSLPIEKGPVFLLRQLFGRLFRVYRPHYSIKEFAKACVGNLRDSTPQTDHKNYDYACDLEAIRNFFEVVELSYSPLPLAGKLNPTVVIKAKKRV